MDINRWVEQNEEDLAQLSPEQGETLSRFLSALISGDYQELDSPEALPKVRRALTAEDYFGE